jgi:4-amino-4-deoxy-L-arabinose transferase-like glycosyltransferase
MRPQDHRSANRSPTMLLVVLFLLHLLLLVWNISGMEFFGEDETGTTLINARTVLGLLTRNPYNLAAAIGSSHPPNRNWVQVPFLALFGVKELAIFLPHILGSLGIFAVLLQIGRTFLQPSGLVFLAVLYSFSAISAYNRSPNGFGLFLFFEITSFYFSLRWEQSGSTPALITAWFLAALGCLTYLEGILFVPYLLGASFLPVRKSPWRVRMRKLWLGLAAFSLPLLIYSVVFYLLPLLVLGKPVGNLEHLLQRQGHLGFTNNLEAFWGHLSAMFSLPLAILLLGSFFFSVIQIHTMPATLRRFCVFFSLHLFIWLFFFKLECGHTLFAYPFFFLNAAYVLQQLQARFHPIFVRNWLFRAGFALIAVYSLYYAFYIFSDLAPVKRLLGVTFQPACLPCGLNYAHQVGLKSAAYWLRTNLSPDDLFLSDTGETMSQFYLDRPSPALSFPQALSALQADPSLNLYARYAIRFIGLNAASPEYGAAATILSHRFTPVLIILDERGAVSYQIWDLFAGPNAKPELIGVNEYTGRSDREFSKIPVRFLRWRDFHISSGVEK